MKETADTTGRFPALDELGTQFLRVARAGSLSRRRLRLRRVALALAVALAVVPGGFALAEDDGSEAGAAGEANWVQAIPERFLEPAFLAERTRSMKPLLNHPEVASRLEAMGYEAVGDITASDIAQLDARAFVADVRAAIDAAQEELGKHPNPNGDNVIGSGVDPAFVQECRANPHVDENWCGIELAKADGKLAPGRYTDAELQAAVRAAGYEWSPSD
jgi:hypothetical protein